MPAPVMMRVFAVLPPEAFGRVCRFMGYSQPAALDTDDGSSVRRAMAKAARLVAEGNEALEDGMIEETEKLLAQGTVPDCPALSGLGYPRVLTYLQGRLDRQNLLALLIQDTRQYAKRQMTWFRHQLPTNWLDVTEFESPRAVAAALANQFEAAIESAVLESAALESAAPRND